MMLSGIQPQLAHKKFKLLFQDIRIDHHEFIAAFPCKTM